MGSATRELSTLQFIETVRSHPCLWNSDLEDYRNLWKKTDIWMNIAETFGYYDADAAKTAWKKLRDNFRDALRRQSAPRVPKGQRALNVTKQTKNWLYQTEMEFLIPFMSNRVSDNYLENIPIEKLCRPVNQEVADPLGDLEESSSVAYQDEVEIIEEVEESPVYHKEPSPPVQDRLMEEQESRMGDSLDIQKPKKSRTKELWSRERRKLIASALQKAESSTPLDQFFSSMCQTTKGFPIKYQVEVKRALFKVVADIEEKLAGTQGGKLNAGRSSSAFSNV